MLLGNIKKLRHNVYLWWFRRMPLQNNKVLLWADNFKSYGCSPKYIAQYLLKTYPGEYDLVWVFDAAVNIPKDIPKEIRTVRYFSIDYLREISTAKFITCNARTGKSHYFNKRKGQIYIQTWHSSLRLKKIEADAVDMLPQSYVDVAKADSAKIDLLLSGCQFSTDIFRRAFWYDGEILECGTPRCDLFFNKDATVREKVFRFYSISSEQKLVLYAPTFRASKTAQTHGLEFETLRKALERKTGEVWTVGCRLHPNLHQDATVDGVISMTSYPDMQELLAAADCLVTDYSSCMFDMAVAGKPCFLYVPDLDNYINNERGLYFDIRELPFSQCRNMTDLITAVEGYVDAEYQNRVSAFLKEIGCLENGHSAMHVAKYIKSQQGAT